MSWHFTPEVPPTLNYESTRELEHAQDLAVQHFSTALALECLGDLNKARDGFPHFNVVGTNLLVLPHANFGVAANLLNRVLVNGLKVAVVAGQLPKGNGQLHLGKAIIRENLIRTLREE